MKRSTIIVLCCVIAILAAIVAAGVAYLYSGITPEQSGAPRHATTASAVVAGPDLSSSDAPGGDSSLTPVEEESDEPQKVAAPAVVAPQPPVPSAEEKEENKKAEASAAAPKLSPQSFKVKNSATGKTCTLRQNAGNVLEMSDHTGKHLWKLQLEAPICGPIAQVDFYNNGKIQYLIAAADKVHLIDRLGREVSAEGFPFTIGGDAVKGPEKAVQSGKTYWKIVTGEGEVYVSLASKRVKILNRIP